MATRTEKFQRRQGEKDDAPASALEVLRFPPEEEACLLEESNAAKAEANELFGKASFQEAIDTYDRALSTCPSYLYYEVAVLKSNVAACYVKLGDWKEAVKAATAALDGLEKLEATIGETRREGDAQAEAKPEEEADEEIVSEGALKAEDTSDQGKQKADMERIRTKALLRRARARSELGGWASLQGAEEDYKILSQRSSLSAADRKLVQQQLLKLPPRTRAAQESEMAEMMGKLKSLGNGILKPFGLSTDNFKMEKDPNTGGYSMNFDQGGK